MPERLVVKMKDLPLLIELVGEDGNKKLYQVLPAGKLGALLNKAKIQPKK